MTLKVALCLSGQPRSYREGFEYHSKNLLDRYNVDTFIHTWDYVPEKMLDNIAELYDPVYVSTETPTKTEIEKTLEKYQNKKSPSEQFPIENTMLMFYSMFKSFEHVHLLYDVIVRSRFDYALNISPPLHLTAVNKLYVPSDRMTSEHDFCADMFAWGTYPAMKRYMETFKYIGKIVEDPNVPFIGEELLSRQLINSGLTGDNMVYVDMNNPFPPGKYNGNWHSILRNDFTDWNKLRD